jgi:PKD repeat protein
MKLSFTIALIGILLFVGKAQCVTTADFSQSKTYGCGPLTVNFTDASTDSGNSLNSWTWDFGDGETSEEQNPSHIYQKSGVYAVKLTVTTSKGCTNIITKNYAVQVFGPDVDFEADIMEGCGTIIVNFKDKTSFGSPVTSRLWNFGDGNTLLSQNATHSYTKTGSFDVSLKVSDLDGCSRTYTIPN